jgi:hypothetical protein
MNEQYLKKVDTAIEESMRRKSSIFNLESLIHYIISKINSNLSNEESTRTLETILIVSKNPNFILLFSKLCPPNIVLTSNFMTHFLNSIHLENYLNNIDI